ncbi:MAG: Gfo/Idh/MocA family oxidoreductase [Clostridia bacterium]|nr:Gfo/Idh/MocA family oxidoreductase [Clostridia bacterium]MBQ6562672.1 Gfo/Idh/MocA family oxidoreductase [Clostridia bacterium]
MAEKVRLGIIGIGNQGSSYAKRFVKENWVPDIELVAIADINPARIAWAKENLSPDLAYFDDAIAMLDSGLINACVVSIPHYDHPRYAMECMKRGIHVMCEKPAGVYTRQVREMNEEAKKHPDVVFGMMFNQRTNCLYRKMRELVQSGKYGRVRRANWLITNWYRSQFYYDSGDWRATWAGEGGGVLLNQCPHQLDLWQWILGMPKKLQSFMRYGQWHDIEVEDDVTTWMEYEDGHTGVFITSTGDPHGSNRFEVEMDGAQLIAEGDKLFLLEFDQLEQDWTKTNKIPFASVPAHEVEVEMDGLNPQHQGVFQAFAGAILRGEPLVAGGEEGINGLTLSNAMHLSAFLGKPVELPFDEDLYESELMKRVATSRRKEAGKSVFSDTTGTY